MESFVENLKRDVQCSLCNDTLTEPKILKCYHSFCKPCIKRHAELIEEVNVFKCPKCKSETPLLKLNSVDDLKPSVLYSRMVKVLEFVESEKVCSVSGSHPPASWHCWDCNRSLCDECQSYHSMFTKNHNLISLVEKDKPDLQLMLSRERSCEQHVDNTVEFFCKDCEMTVCVGCLKDTHDEHRIVTLEKYTALNKAHLCQQLEELEDLEEEMKNQVEIIEEETNKFKANSEKAKLLVKENLREAIDTLQKNAQELLEEIDDNIDKAERRKIRGQSVLDQTRGAIEYTKTLIEKGVASEIMENKDIKKACYASIDRVVGKQPDVVFFANEELTEQVKSGLGFLEMVDNSDASMSSVFLSVPLKERKKAKLSVKIMTRWRKLNYNPNDNIDVKIYPLDKVETLRKVVRTNGVIDVEFMPRVAGQLTIEVQVDGKHVSNSPLVVNVQQADMYYN